MRFRDRPRREARREAFRDVRPTMLIVCEGRRTEPEYLNGFAKRCRNARVKIELVKSGGVPKTVVEVAKQKKLENDKAARREKDPNIKYDSIWCVCDVDDHPNLGSAMEMARDNGMSMAISNPCFELWLLLHFRDHPGSQHRDDVSRALRAFITGYNKEGHYELYESGYSQAARRAKELADVAKNCGEPHRNPTTDMFRLTAKIAEESKPSTAATGPPP